MGHLTLRHTAFGVVFLGCPWLSLCVEYNIFNARRLYTARKSQTLDKEKSEKSPESSADSKWDPTKWLLANTRTINTNMHPTAIHNWPCVVWTRLTFRDMSEAHSTKVFGQCWTLLVRWIMVNIRYPALVVKSASYLSQLHCETDTIHTPNPRFFRWSRWNFYEFRIAKEGVWKGLLHLANTSRKPDKSRL